MRLPRTWAPMLPYFDKPLRHAACVGLVHPDMRRVRESTTNVTHIWRAAVEGLPDRRCSADWTSASEAGTVFGRSATPCPSHEQLPGQLPTSRSITGPPLNGLGKAPFHFPASLLGVFVFAALAAVSQMCLPNGGWISPLSFPCSTSSVTGLDCSSHSLQR